MLGKAFRATGQGARVVTYGITKTAKDIRKHIITAISAAFAFVIALTWRDFINEGLDHLLENLGMQGDAYAYKFLAALLVTVICVLGIIFMARLEKSK
jgi:hypothetical protein